MGKWVLRAVVVVALAGGWMVLKRTLLAPAPVVVQVVTVTRGRVESTVTNSRAGTVRARRRAQLSPETSGRVVELHFREGDTVKAGDVLVRLDDEVAQKQRALALATLDTARARHEETCVRARRAARELERNRTLASERIISEDLLEGFESTLEGASAACASAAAAVAQAEAEIPVIDAELTRLVLRAPFDGVLAEVAAEVGEWITPSPPGVPIPSVIDLIDPTSIYVSAPMDEVDSAVIRAGLPVRVTLDPYRGRSFAGHVARVSPYVLDVEEQNRTVEIEVELDDRSLLERLLPGTSADVEVVLDAKEDVLRIPTSTLLEGGRVYLFEEGTIVERSVKVGMRNWDWVEVVEGLSGSERLVRSLGEARVAPGAEAVLAEERPEP